MPSKYNVMPKVTECTLAEAMKQWGIAIHFYNHADLHEHLAFAFEFQNVKYGWNMFARKSKVEAHYFTYGRKTLYKFFQTDMDFLRKMNCAENAPSQVMYMLNSLPLHGQFLRKMCDYSPKFAELVGDQMQEKPYSRGLINFLIAIRQVDKWLSKNYEKMLSENRPLAKRLATHINTRSPLGYAVISGIIERMDDSHLNKWWATRNEVGGVLL